MTTGKFKNHYFFVNKHSKKHSPKKLYTYTWIGVAIAIIISVYLGATSWISSRPTLGSSPAANPAAIVPAANGEPVLAVTSANQTVAGDIVLSQDIATNTATQAAIRYVEYRLNNTKKITQTAAPFALDTTTLDDGAYSINQTIFYKDGTTAQQQASVIVNNGTATKRLLLAIAGGGMGAIAILGALFAHPRTRPFMMLPIDSATRLAQRLRR